MHINSKTANINKIVNASVNQINDINLIKKLKKFEELPDYLKEIAIIRITFCIYLKYILHCFFLEI